MDFPKRPRKPNFLRVTNPPSMDIIGTTASGDSQLKAPDGGGKHSRKRNLNMERGSFCYFCGTGLVRVGGDDEGTCFECFTCPAGDPLAMER